MPQRPSTLTPLTQCTGARGNLDTWGVLAPTLPGGQCQGQLSPRLPPPQGGEGTGRRGPGYRAIASLRLAYPGPIVSQEGPCRAEGPAPTNFRRPKTLQVQTHYLTRLPFSGLVAKTANKHRTSGQHTFFKRKTLAKHNPALKAGKPHE